MAWDGRTWATGSLAEERCGRGVSPREYVAASTYRPELGSSTTIFKQTLHRREPLEGVLARAFVARSPYRNFLRAPGEAWVRRK